MCRYSSLASALVANGQPVGHLVHIAGAVAASSAVAGVLRVLQLIQQSIEDKKREAERQVGYHHVLAMVMTHTPDAVS